MNYSITPIMFRGQQFNSIKDAIEQTGMSRYLIKKEAVYVNESDKKKFEGFGRKKKQFNTLPSKQDILNVYDGNIRLTAKALGVTEAILNQLINEYNIKHINLSEAITIKSDKNKPTKQELLDQYATSSIGDLLTHYNIGYNKLMRWFKSYDIVVRPLGETAAIKHAQRHESIKPSYDVLNSEYKTKTIYELSLQYGVDKHVVSNWLIEYGIDVTTNKSRGEQELFNYCKSIDDSFVQNDRTLIAPLELDMVSHKHKLAIEYCGIYWHSETMGKTKQYHRNKFLKCNELGYTLLTVFESDDQNKVRALIRTKLNGNEKIYARQTSIKIIDSRTAAEFHRAHHLSNSIGGTVHIGLFYQNELVMVSTFSKSRYNKKYEYECGRMTSHSKYTVVGGASKIFKYFFNKMNVKSCITYADLRFGNGSVYKYCGMERLNDTSPNYFYFNSSDFILESRVKYQKHKLKAILKNYNPNLSEHDNMINNGYHKIWDCGNAVYVYRK